MSASIRWIDLTDDQKKVVYQIRNTESGRKNRKKWRENDKEMEQLYKDNEQRILQLEELCIFFRGGCTKKETPKLDSKTGALQTAIFTPSESWRRCPS